MPVIPWNRRLFLGANCRLCPQHISNFDTGASLKIGIVGFGAMARSLTKLLAQYAPDIAVLAVMVRDIPEVRSAALPPGARFVRSVQDLLAQPLDLVVECAGHAALRSTGVAILESGVDLLVASVGALADVSVEATLVQAAKAGHAKLRIPSGALGGLDVLGAARMGGLQTVMYRSRKAPQAWFGTPAEHMIDLAHLTEEATFFMGNARSAALAFPQNANVAAAVALAGMGFEKTQVHLTADPSAIGNTHLIEATGEFGSIHIVINGRTLVDNPKTSMLAPLSLVRCLLNLSQSIVIA